MGQRYPFVAMDDCREDSLSKDAWTDIAAFIVACYSRAMAVAKTQPTAAASSECGGHLMCWLQSRNLNN